MAISWTFRTIFFALVLTLAGAIKTPQDVDELFRPPTAEEVANFQSWVASVGERTKAQPTVDPINVKPGAYFHSQATAVMKEGDMALYVDHAGAGQFLSVKEALDAIPSDSSRTQRIVIKVAPGTYVEKLIIGTDKPYVTLQGAGQWNTKISWKEDLAQSGSDITDAAGQIAGDFFTAMDISFENTSPAPPSGAVGKQATALAISGDSATFLRVGFFGFQDTLYDRMGRHYFQDCYITGSIDFIYGDGQSFYSNCQLNVIPVEIGSLTAQKRQSTQENSGYSFVGCKVTGAGRVYLGRAWGPAALTVFSHCYLADIIIPQGWFDWGISARDKTVFYGEYMNFGPGANMEGRVGYSHQLTAAEAKPFQDVSFIDGYSWLPSSGVA